MSTDEQQIRQLITAWMDASRAGDLDTVLDLMTDDVVFLVAGRPPMNKQEFASLSRAQGQASAPTIDGTSEIQEIKVLGEWAFVWTKLSVVATPRDGSAAIERAGHTLTLFRKDQGRWRLARDANMLAPVPARES